MKTSTVQQQQGQVDSLRAGLVALCECLGVKASYDELGFDLPRQDGELPLVHVPKALRPKGIVATITKLPVENIKSHQLPLLMLTKDKGAVVIVGRQESTFEVVVPETYGQKKFSLTSLKQLSTNDVVLADRRYYADKRSGDYAKPYQEHWLRHELLKYWPFYIDVGVASLFANLLAVGTSLFALQVYDRVVPSEAFDTLLVLTVGVVIAVIFDFILRLCRAFIIDKSGKRIDIELSTQLFRQVLGIRLSAKPQSTGAFSSQIREFETVREFFTSSTVATLSDFPFVFMFLLLIWYIGGPVVWVPILAIALMVVPSLLLQRKLAFLARENLRDGAVKYGLMLEAIEHLETVKASSAEVRNLSMWESLTRQQAEDTIRLKNLSNKLTMSAAMVQQFAFIFVVVVGVFQISANELTVGGLIACTMLSSRAVGPMNQLTGILVRWQHVKVALDGLDQIMQAPVERDPDRSYSELDVIHGSYEMEGVKVVYGEETEPALVLKSLRISAGSRVILLGGNGAGKSTLLRVLAGLEDLREGQLTLDDIALSQLEPARRKRAIGYLPQDVALFYGTLRENLLLNQAHYTDEEIYAVLDGIGLGPSVRAHALGLDMPIMGNKSLSGGQRQAVGLARIILQDPKIVLLDEPTASFDQASEDRVLSYLKHWLEGRTLVMSTHKRKLLALGERGVVLSKGRIQMDGKFDDILKRARL